MNLGLLVASENANKQTDRHTRFMFYKYRFTNYYLRRQLVSLNLVYTPLSKQGDQIRSPYLNRSWPLGFCFFKFLNSVVVFPPLRSFLSVSVTPLPPYVNSQWALPYLPFWGDLSANQCYGDLQKTLKIFFIRRYISWKNDTLSRGCIRHDLK